MSDKRFFDVKTDVIDYTRDRHGRIPSMVIAVGRRGAGKTHSCLKEALIHCIRDVKSFVYVRRVTTEITSSMLNQVFVNVVSDPEVIEAINASEYQGYTQYAVLSKGGIYWLCGVEGNNLTWLREIGIATCISMAQHFKGGSYPDHDRCIFDEFISSDRYINGDKEPERLQMIVETMGRTPPEGGSKNVITYLCGNPDNSIEACPYLYKLHLDYRNLQPDIPYYFERKNHEITTFIKITRHGHDDFLDASVSDLFETAEEYMAQTGEAKENQYILLTNDILDMFTPMYCLEVETPIISNKEYHKRIYCYYGQINNSKIYPEYVLIVTGHDMIKCNTRIYCRYDAARYIPVSIPQTFRINIPREQKFNDLMRIMSHVDDTRLIFTTANAHATLFESIRLNSK